MHAQGDALLLLACLYIYCSCAFLTFDSTPHERGSALPKVARAITVVTVRRARDVSCMRDAERNSGLLHPPPLRNCLSPLRRR